MANNVEVKDGMLSFTNCHVTIINNSNYFNNSQQTAKPVRQSQSR